MGGGRGGPLEPNFGLSGHFHDRKPGSRPPILAEKVGHPHLHLSADSKGWATSPFISVRRQKLRPAP
jgi:hypothetical protein